MNNEKSPITHSGNIKIIKQIDTEKIIQLYKQDFNLDVSNFFEGLESIDIIECKETYYRFYSPKSVSGDEVFYESLQKVKGTNGYYLLWRWEHDFIFKQLIENEKIIDIGCGSGNFLNKLKDKTPFAIGLEFNDLAIDNCRAKGLKVYKTDVESFSKLRENQSYFDVVCAFQVLEHIYAVDSFILSCLKCLKPGGKLIIGVPNNNPFLHKYDFLHTLNLPPHHMGLWNKKSLKKLQKFYPIKLSLIISEPNFNFDYWLNIQARKWLGVKNISSLLKKIRLYFWVTKFSKYTEGRNLLAIYLKDRE